MGIEPLLQVNNLKKYFHLSKGRTLKALDGVSFQLKQGETFGLVGESGCGKSTLGKVLMRLYDPTDGEALYEGKSLHHLSKRESFDFNRQIQMVFQDPYSSLNPRLSVKDIMLEPMEIHDLYGSQKKRITRVKELLEAVGLSYDFATRYPHEFSGGQRQRIGIARALALAPKFVVADEPISALDVSVQAQVVNLLKKLQEEQGLTFLFIAHDLSMIKYISDRIGVMYLGHLVEMTSSDVLNKTPLHPYTQALLSAIPIPDPDVEDKRKRFILKGEIPSPVNPPSGCVFRTRCPAAMDVCAERKPTLQVAEEGHEVACHLYDTK
ncbi:oligopeptide/dipeptide ABC transporter ATP-binding protein [Bacillus sp. FJAT-53060]|uniref:ABC transporter ATP-binding protein n=1 Tax=Bacillus TaxID=1386 RepID=UPI001CFA7403|nr:oligopeptide/dipeptide ABC transporter ATP-binding protein [Bacillus stratosphericus]